MKTTLEGFDNRAKRGCSKPSMGIFQELIMELAEKQLTKEELNRLKIRLCKKYSVKRIPTDIDIMMHATPSESVRLVTKPIRSASGIVPVAVIVSPASCRHGRCIYCPGGPDSAFGSVPQSYTGREPAAMRAARCNYDPYLQVFSRLEQYSASGHAVNKAELIIMGGTFPSRRPGYQDRFVALSLKALNDFSTRFIAGDGNLRISRFKEFFLLPGSLQDRARVRRISCRLKAMKGRARLNAEQGRNKHSRVRCVAMCIETRPDFCREQHINQMLRLGTTRVELGVQSLHNDVLKKIRRGHSVDDVVNATALMKDSLLKVGYHIMPGLPGSDVERDKAMFRQLFDDNHFRPDALKIYPCMVMRGTRLYDMWRKGWYKPLTTSEAAELICSLKERIPEYCRIMRIQRDIPTKCTEAGVDMTNLRQHVASLMREKGIKCRCIRCRQPRPGEVVSIDDAKVRADKYEASGSVEYFISAEYKDRLFGFCRLRLPARPFRPEIKRGSAGIRELHVYSEALPIGARSSSSAQHQGLGMALVREAERIAREELDARSMLVISGIGAREYYRKKLGYRKCGAYMKRGL